MANTPSSQTSIKHLAIVRANARTVVVVSVASFVTVFCLIASKTVLSQNQYQMHVTSAKQKAHVQLQENIQTFSSLANSYNNFVNEPTNVIGGSASGTGQNSGNNAQIILDALPDSYDFPALATSIEKILSSQGLNITGISGTDEQLSEQANTSSANPQPVSMPFSFSISNTNYAGISRLITTLQESIRPIVIDQLTLSGGASNMTLTVNAHTYYQPALDLNITNEVVK